MKGGEKMNRRKPQQRIQRYYSWNEVPVLLDCVMAGQLLGVTPESIGKMCRDGTLPATKLGKYWTIRKSTIQAMVEEETKEGDKNQ